MRSIALAALLLCCAAVHAAFERQFPGCEAAAMGGAGVAGPASPWSLLQNPARLAGVPAVSAALFHVPSSFGLSEFARSALAGAVPTPAGCVSAAVTLYGFALYREVTAGAGWGGTLAEGVTAGVALHYHMLSIEGYGSAGAPGLDAGVAAEITPDLVWGATVRNIIASGIGASGERLPRSAAFGASYRPVESVLILADLVKDIRYAWELRLGVSYRPVEALVLRLGSCSEPGTLHAGGGVHAGPFGFEYAYIHHPEVGGTHHLGLTFGGDPGP